jgi:hypothetical protein
MELIDKTLGVLLEVGLWALLITLLNTVLVSFWYAHLLRIARKPWKSMRTFIVILVAPLWMILIFTVLALVAAGICPTKGYFDNYRYYLVATIFGKKQARSLYGVRKLEPRKFFHRGFANFRK